MQSQSPEWPPSGRENGSSSPTVAPFLNRNTPPTINTVFPIPPGEYFLRMYDRFRCCCCAVFATNRRFFRRKDYERARLLYGKAFRAMKARGPDVQLLLFAFAVFCLITGVRFFFLACLPLRLLRWCPLFQQPHVCSPAQIIRFASFCRVFVPQISSMMSIISAAAVFCLIAGVRFFLSRVCLSNWFGDVNDFSGRMFAALLNLGNIVRFASVCRGFVPQISSTM